MKKKKYIKEKKDKINKYYKYIDIIRIFSCIAVLLYHLNVLKGGYLAVCCFFALSGYLSCVSAFKKENFSLLQYYKNRLLKIYVPLIVVVFFSIPIVLLLNSVSLISFKREIISILLGYNNFWQLSANLDYFSRHIDSPFMHFWYISILFQYELIFPFLFMILKKIGDKFNKKIPIILTIFLGLGSILYFFKLILSSNIMGAYYNSFSRSFSWLFGIGLGFYHTYFKNITPKEFKNKNTNKFILITCFSILTILFLLVKADSNLFGISMIITTLITLYLVDFATAIKNIRREKIELEKEKIIKSISEIIYEVYLVQYPVIFVLSLINGCNILNNLLTLIIVILLSCFIHYTLKNIKVNTILLFISKFVLFSICIFGLYKFIVLKDYTKEMNMLEEQLIQNELVMKQKQAQYNSNYELQKNEFESTIQKLQNYEENLEQYIRELPVVGIGDSVMLGAVPNLYSKFQNGYFDAQISRTAYVITDILNNLKEENRLGEPIIINLGANGDCTDDFKDYIMQIIGEREVFWVNVANDYSVHVNDRLLEYSNNYDNLHVIDWNKISNGHSEYFYSDGIHLTELGRDAYVEAIYESIYNFYFDKYVNEKNEIIKSHEETIKNKISFYGNDILLNSYDLLETYFKEEKFKINKNFDFNLLKSEIVLEINNDTLTNKIVLAFDSSSNISIEQYKEIIKFCKDQKIYIVSSNKESGNNLKKLNYDNVEIIDFYNEIEKNSDYVMIDNVHLTDKGNRALIEFLINALNSKNI